MINDAMGVAGALPLAHRAEQWRTLSVGDPMYNGLQLASKQSKMGPPC